MSFWAAAAAFHRPPIRCSITSSSIRQRTGRQGKASPRVDASTCFCDISITEQKRWTCLAAEGGERRPGNSAPALPRTDPAPTMRIGPLQLVVLNQAGPFIPPPAHPVLALALTACQVRQGV